jgi:hypothetical protein
VRFVSCFGVCCVFAGVWLCACVFLLQCLGFVLFELCSSYGVSERSIALQETNAAAGRGQ